MGLWNNATGRPLADATWLEAHHIAKLPERRAFANRLRKLEPRTVLDLGCATGLWLELLNEVLPSDCRFIGLDSDEQSLEIARKRSEAWSRETDYVCLDIERNVAEVPSADLVLAFNVFPYISDLDEFLRGLFNRLPHARLAVRQYDGASIRFGPMDTADRQNMESSLRIAAESSQQFNHYDLDRAIAALRKLDTRQCEFNFELFARSDPFPQDFLPYYEQTIEWTRALLPKAEADKLQRWVDLGSRRGNRYFFEVDLVALLS